MYFLPQPLQVKFQYDHKKVPTFSDYSSLIGLILIQSFCQMKLIKGIQMELFVQND